MIGDTARSDQAQASVIDRGLLLRYRVMAFTTATLLIIIVFVGIPLQFAARRPEVVNDVGTVHGFLYIVYLFVAFQLTRKLGVAKWQMGLVLLAGTVPFCGFVAERKMTRRFDAVVGAPADESPEKPATGSLSAYATRVRTRWFSRRAVMFHVEVVIVATGCLAAGWWQATRALAGNGLSWVYTIEWPVFALIAIGGWWFLIHEEPEAYKARKHGAPEAEAHLSAEPAALEISVEQATARLAKVLGGLLVLELALGIVVLVLVPIGRPSTWLPSQAEAIYLAHAILGIPLAFGAAVLVWRVRYSSRLSRLSGWIGAVGVAVAGFGGLVTVAHPLRIAGMALMFIGAVVAGFGYLIPTFEKLSS
jgi:integral membrane protein